MQSAVSRLSMLLTKGQSPHLRIMHNNCVRSNKFGQRAKDKI